MIANTSKPAPVVAQTGVQKLLSTATNASTITSYNDENADKGKMFVFNHEATEQTGALTDYRYIGDDPNNYVKFNCDNDGTNCEIWRIIGVFEVDDGTGKYEQRIKLVRGSVLPTEMQWDNRESETYDAGNSHGKNEWNGAKLNIFLNEDYLNKSGEAVNYGLNQLAQSQIAEAKYYLGGVKYNFNLPNYGSSEDKYSFERGTDVFSYNNYCSFSSWDSSCNSNFCDNNPTNLICNVTRSISWTGKIGLMYPSDYGYTYSNGVDDKCYNDPGQCASWANPIGNPTLGWIYNSNKYENQINGERTWLLSPSANSSSMIFIVYNNDGVVNSDGRADYTSAVRPVVYLKSSIQIIDGEGTEQDPYVLQ